MSLTEKECYRVTRKAFEIHSKRPGFMGFFITAPNKDALWEDWPASHTVNTVVSMVRILKDYDGPIDIYVMVDRQPLESYTLDWIGKN